MDDLRPSATTTVSSDSRPAVPAAFLPKRTARSISSRIIAWRRERLNIRKGSRDIFVHGSYRNSSPVKYASNSGLFRVGSSHGVSLQRRLRHASSLWVSGLTADQKREENDACAPHVYRLRLVSP
jgi:hypothetical protein